MPILAKRQGANMDWFYGLLQSWVAQFIGWIVVVGVPTLLAWAKSKDWRYTQPVLYWVVAFAVLSTAFVAITNIPQMPKQIAAYVKGNTGQITPQDIQAKVRSWLDTPRYSVKQVPGKRDASYHFNYEVAWGDKACNIYLPKGEPKVIWFSVIAGLDKESVDRFQKLSPKEQNVALAALKVELLQFKIQFSDLKAPLTDVRLSHALPYDENRKRKSLQGSALSLRRWRCVI
jgi:hypothetical protein